MGKLGNQKLHVQRGPIVIESFPGIGGVASITGRYIIDFFNLKPMVDLDIRAMPPVTVVKKHRPVPTITVYGGKLPNGTKLAVIRSELPAPENAIREVASEIVKWAESAKASLLLSPQGMVVESDETEHKEVAVYGTASGEVGMNMLRIAGIEMLEEGYVTGIPGLLLHEGMKNNLNTIALLTETSDNQRDTAAAALMVHAVDRLCLKYDLDCGPICDVAVQIETRESKIKREAKSDKMRSLISMYR